MSAAGRGPRTVVLLHLSDSSEPHDRHTRMAMGERIAALCGCAFAGDFDPQRRYGTGLYFVPDLTLAGERAAALRIAGEQDLFGGVVPFPWMTHKTISHGLVAPEAAAPPGWSHRLATALADTVLPGYSAFGFDDAVRAGRQLLAHGPARVKQARGVGGLGQTVVQSEAELRTALRAIDPAELHQDGVVVELDLRDAETYSVGRVRMGGLSLVYHGIQYPTTARSGETVYGGSELIALRGDFATLAARELPTEVAAAVGKALAFDARISAAFPAFFASRRNYDVIRGRDAAGRWRCGVLEQSWRFGGASPAEIAALEWLQRHPDAASVRAAAHERHREEAPPPGASVYYHRREGRGPVMKYTLIRHDGHQPGNR